MLAAFLVFVLVAGSIIGGYFAVTLLPGIFAARRLDRRLREHHAGCVAKRIGFWDHIDPAYQLALCAKMLRGRKRCDIG